MPRLKEYHREDVLNAATKVFWEKGYVGSSMSDLVSAAKLNKHSMYKEFGSKEGLYLACIDNYVTNTTKELGRILTQKPLGFKNIENFFANRVDYVSSNNFIGCLLVEAVIAKEVLSNSVNNRSKKYITHHEKLFYNCLKAAEENGEIPKNKDLKFYAKYLLCFLEGMMVLGKTNNKKKTLEELVKKVLAAVKE
jgi:TetR/AcrR family transcriptional repressor of nem operon